MLRLNNISLARAAAIAMIVATAFTAGCEKSVFQSANNVAVTMKDIPAVRLNYRYEGDVPAPEVAQSGQPVEEKNAAVQADFDTNRTQELLDRTVTSPDKKSVLAVYRNVFDQSSESRLDMYTPDGKLIRKITPEAMAVHFPDTIVWSPDSVSVAFVAMLRAVGVQPLDPTASPVPVPTIAAGIENTVPETANSNIDPEPSVAPTESVPDAAAPTGILTYRTEQIYICDAAGSSLKALTQNEGLIYFYFAWSPDSSMLAAMAATRRDWQYFELVAASKGEVLIPQGRLRVVEKNGRERRLEDNLSSVRPVWSPDSAKIAIAFDNQIRLYDAAGTAPTQAAIPLRNQLLISAQAYDIEQQRIGQAENTNTEANTAANAEPAPEQLPNTLPDEKLLVSFNPIVEIQWPSDSLLYLKTAYIRRMKIETESVTSFSRWHRLVLSAQQDAVPAR